MAVMTHTQIPSITLPIAADYNALHPAQQDAFRDWMDKADNAGTGDGYHKAMRKAARTAGMAVPDSEDIAVCDCLNDGCGCGAIFDSALPGVVVTATNDPGCNLSALQCPDCGHDHPRPIAN